MSSKFIDTGEIYSRMIHCLYKKFTIHSNIEYNFKEFVRTISKIGKLAYETLLSGNPLLQRSQVIKDVGADAFNYGLLIGHEDFRLIRDETADIYVTFPHRSIQEFLGAFYYILMLDSGKSVDIDDEKLIVMKNPLFLHFCLWFLPSGQKYFTFKNTDEIYNILICCFYKRILSFELALSELARTYPAFDIESVFDKKDKLTLNFFQEILAKCMGNKALFVESIEPVEWILCAINFQVSHM